MKILYAFQGTGNGHIARAQEIVPILKKYAAVDTFISGHQTQLGADFNIDYRYRGISLLYNKSGGVSYRKTFLHNDFSKAKKDIERLQLSGYDLIINDFEPLTAWACKLNKIRLIELGHQASFKFLETPKPPKRNFLGEWILNNYVPSKNQIGFHFENYHPQIKKPVIRRKIRNLSPINLGFYVVYLPSFSNETIVKTLKKIPVEWKVFSKNTKLNWRESNVEIFPIDELLFLSYFEKCAGILCSAGFETPAEALFMNKKLFVIPIQNQYEQECNAFALDQMGVPNSEILDSEEIKKWAVSDMRIAVNYPNDIEEIIGNEVLNL